MATNKPQIKKKCMVVKRLQKPLQQVKRKTPLIDWATFKEDTNFVDLKHADAKSCSNIYGMNLSKKNIFN